MSAIRIGHACAYLEKKDKAILIECRDGEPDIPTQFIKNMPPFKPKLSKKTIARVVELREVEKASFVTIAKKWRMTQAKAKRTYEMFYHKQILALIKALQGKAERQEKKAAIWNYYLRRYHSSKKRLWYVNKLIFLSRKIGLELSPFRYGANVLTGLARRAALC